MKTEEKVKFNLEKGKISQHSGKEAHTTGTNFGLFGIKRLGAFLHSPRWDASPSESYPQH